jgi:hypothetical protein
MCQPIQRNLTRNAIEATELEPVERDEPVITDQMIADAFYEEEVNEPDYCPSGCNGSGCFNCR